MPKNEKLISLVLSGMLVTGILTGCNDNDDVNVPNTESSVTAVDDYIYNGKLTAVVYDESTKTIKEIPGKTVVAYLNKKTNTLHEGSEKYTKPFIRPEQHLLYYKFEKATDLSTFDPNCANTTDYECYPTFVDLNNNKKYDADVDLAFDTTFYVTKLSEDSKISVVTPVTTLSLDVVKSENSGTTLEEAINNYLQNNGGNVTNLMNYLYAKNAEVLNKVVTKLGYKLNATTNDIAELVRKIILTDPMTVSSKILKYNLLVNNIISLVHKNNLGYKFYQELNNTADIVASSDDELINKGLKNIQTILTNINDPSLVNAKNVVDKILSYENEANPADILASINPGLSIKNGDLTTDTLNITQNDMLINSIGFKTNTTTVTDFHNIFENGYKLDNSNPIKLTLDWYTNGKEANISFANQPLTFVLDFKKIGNTEANASASSSELQIIVPTKVTASIVGDNILYTGIIDGNDNITVNAMLDDGTSTSLVFKAEDLLGTDLNTTFDGKELNINNIVTNAIAKANTDYNITLPNPINNVTNLNVYLKNENIKKIITNSEGNIVGSVPYTTTSIVIPGTTNTDSGYVPMINDSNIYADWRGNRLDKNAKPEYNSTKITIPAGITIKDFNTLATINSGDDITGKTIIYNINRTIPDQQVQFVYGKTDIDTWETNTKFTLASEFDPTAKNRVLANIDTTSLEVNTTDPATITVTLDNNNTIDDYNITNEHPKYVLKYNIKDEFGKEGEVNTTIYMNREPILLPLTNDVNVVFGYYTLDNNGTASTLSSYDTNNTLISTAASPDEPAPLPAFVALDVDGLDDVSQNYLTYKIENVDINTSYNYSISDINISDGTITNLGTTDNFVLFKDHAKQITIDDGEGNTTTIILHPTCTDTGGCNFQVSAKTDAGKWAADTTVTVGIGIKDKYDLEGKGGFVIFIKSSN